MFSRAEIDWIIGSGLGPLLWSVLERHPGLVDPGDRLHVKSADLSAYMLSAELFETLDEILREASRAGLRITLLKGASVARDLYPHSHWRMMRDLDLLVTRGEQPHLESLLGDMGFSQQARRPAEFFERHHHSMPFFSASRRCWVEVHSALFREDSPLGQDTPFTSAALETCGRIPLQLDGNSADRLSNELEFVYTIVHWAGKLTLAGGMVPVLDILLMLDRRGDTLDWDRVLELCETEPVGRYVWLLLSYLERHDLYSLPSDVRLSLRGGEQSIGKAGVRLLHGVVDDYMAAGRRPGGINSETLLNQRWETLLGDGSVTGKLLRMCWQTAFPERASGRYSPLTHWRRVRRHWLARGNRTPR
ncbi:MAG: nucleotidyltransferase family protein [Thiohalobacterales bacterium]|nr:nucleotidyltransferase family protein [Thiohalobacterales bacterium]